MADDPPPSSSLSSHPPNTSPLPIYRKFINCRVLHPDGHLYDANVVVTLSTGSITKIIPVVVTDSSHDIAAGYNSEDGGNTNGCDQNDDNNDVITTTVDVVDCHGKILSPGLIDLQVNGAYGVDFSNPSLTVNDVQYVARRLTHHGVTSFCPTLISCAPSTYRNNIPLLSSLCDQQQRRVPPLSTKDKHDNTPPGATILGLHLEGPFFAPDKRGAHPLSHITDPLPPHPLTRIYGGSNDDDDDDDETTNDNLRHVAIITMAPERPNAITTIRHLTRQHNIVVSLGHSDATYDDGRKAIENGATMVTHLYNAMRGFHHREPGLIGLCLGGSEKKKKRPYFGIIADGIHCHPSAVRMAHEAHPEGMILVSDAMSAMGLGLGRHSLGGSEVVIRSDGRATLGDGETLAGSVVSLEECVRNVRGWIGGGGGCGEALMAATRRPAMVLGLEGERGVLDVGCVGDLVLWDDDGGGMVVVATWVGGRCVFDREGGIRQI